MIHPRLAVVTGCASLLAACSPSPSQPPDLCEQDALQCGGSDVLEVDITCTPMDELRVQVGQGNDVYQPFAANEAPMLYNGPQGGQHMFVAARIENPDPAHASFQLEFSLYSSSGAAPPDDLLGSRGATINNASLQPDLSFEQAGLTFRVYGDLQAAPLRLELVASDGCGRQGTAAHEFAY